MAHKHFWTESAKKEAEDLKGVFRRIIAECECGELLLDEQNGSHEHFWQEPKVRTPDLVAECSCGETLHKSN